MREQDPYGWFQWFCRYHLASPGITWQMIHLASLDLTCLHLSCRFYQGRRTEDDQRQVDRWSKCAGPKGRGGAALPHLASPVLTCSYQVEGQPDLEVCEVWLWLRQLRGEHLHLHLHLHPHPHPGSRKPTIRDPGSQEGCLLAGRF